MKIPTVILSALFAFSFIAALPLPADTSSLAYLVKKDITSLPQAIKRQIDEDSSGDGSNDTDSDEDSGSDDGLDFLMKTRRQSGDSSGDDSWKGDGGEKHRL